LLLCCVSILLSFFSRFAAATPDGTQYYVLLIITDGVITDMQQTQQAIVNVSTKQTTGDRQRK
jgi:hypothetical protein